ncbi:cyclin-domain-containing protein [Crepidotus variabilis]|uniref:Cyclin-domain-containing protein n=1 Tax=Crepidotus variabilis TaxID=179855 RepID=A0A9P6EH00_9AGAR|nr:cyclin-domain-containing protein [Crepidotus variabilis]
MESSSSERVEMPAGFEDASLEHIVDLIADMLQRLISHNDRIPLSPESLTRFHSRSAPSISVIDYLKRIVRFTNVEVREQFPDRSFHPWFLAFFLLFIKKSVLLVTLFNIDQICARMPLFTLSSLTCHRFIITSITVSSKALCDVFCTNNLYAKVGGVTVTELNMLEREFLAMIEWRLTVSIFIIYSILTVPSADLSFFIFCCLPAQCNRDILQEYYINLVRTHSSGKYIIIGSDSSQSGSTSDSSDQEMDTNGAQSRPDSPTETRHPRRTRFSASPSEPSAILIEPGAISQDRDPVAQRPTVAQNMAFAALQQSNEFHTLSADSRSNKQTG